MGCPTLTGYGLGVDITGLPAEQAEAAAPTSVSEDLSGPDRPIFVVGCPRSGTTLLQLMLHAHPRIACPPETRHMIETYRRRRTFGDLRKEENRQALADYITKRPKFKDLKLDKADVRRKIVAGPPTVGSALGIVLREYASKYGKPRWSDKRPVYLNHLDMLFNLFPDAQVISIVRDGRACVASLKRMPWWKSGSMSATGRWVQAMRMQARARRKYRPDQYYEIQYERLVADPEAELRKLCAFMGEEFDEAMLEPSRVAGEAVPEHKSWHVRTHQEVSTAAIKAWQSQLEPWEVAVVERVGRRWLRYYGYELTKPQRPPLRKLYEAYSNLVQRELQVARLHRRDSERREKEKRPIAARLTSGQLRLEQERKAAKAAAKAAAPKPQQKA